MVAKRGLAVACGKKVRRNELRSLMDQLIERMLAVGPWFSPDDRPGRMIDLYAIAANGFAVAFHVGLLEVSREAMQMLVVGQHGVA
jgi:hypothetical protein